MSQADELSTAWIDGEWIPFHNATVRLSNLALWGIAATEMLRTFAGRPFRLREHLERLDCSAAGIGFELPFGTKKLEGVVNELCDRNFSFIDQTSDLGVSIFSSAGHNTSWFAPRQRAEAQRPSICISSFELPFDLWQTAAREGVHLVTSTVRQLPAESVSPQLKTRSRLHWHLAKRDARSRHSDGHPLLLDEAGRITETSTSNIFAVIDDEILTPGENVLHGVSRAFVLELARSIGLTCRSADLGRSDVSNASECFLSSSLSCLLPATKMDGKLIRDGNPGPVYQQLVSAWSDSVDVDIADQIAANQRVD